MSNSNDRKEAYSIIQEVGLQDEIKKKFGKNYTQVSNKDLWEYINETVELVEEKSVEEVYDEIKSLVEAGIFTTKELDAIIELVTELRARINEFVNIS